MSVTAEASMESAQRCELITELWVSLASLLRSYTAAHGLNGNRQATVELGGRTDYWCRHRRNDVARSATERRCK